MEVLTQLIDYSAVAITFYQSIYCFLICGFSCLILCWGQRTRVGTAAAASAASVSIVCMYALLSLGRHLVLSCLFNHPENHAFLCN
jgi:hypothetical protein